MTSDWKSIDWDEDRPGATAIAASHEAVRYAALNPSEYRSPAVEELIAALTETRTNGGVLLGGFEVTADDTTARWFAARNRFDEYGFFAHFLGSDAVRAALPELDVPDPLVEIEFEPSWTRTLGLDGEWAATLVFGGAYKSYDGRQPEAKRIGLDAVAALVCDRHADFRLYTSTEAWAGWFEPVAWDHTWLLIDQAYGRFYLLCITDTD